MDRRPLDLRDEKEREVIDKTPDRSLMYAGIILAVAGIVIAAVVPELLAEEEREPEKDLRTPLSILLSCTIDEVSTGDSTFTDIALPQAYYALLENDNGNMTPVEDVAREYLGFMLGADTPFELKISSGQGWDREVSYSLTNGPADGTSETYEQDVVVRVEAESQITMIFKLSVWEVK